MKPRPGADPTQPLELRIGATDRFYLIWGGDHGFLADGDLVITSTWAADGVTLTGPLINAANLTLDGITYGPGLVTSVEVSAITLEDLVELTNTMTSQSGRIEKQSLWVRGVPFYTDD